MYTLAGLTERLKAVYRAMTGGKFSEGLRLVNLLLLLIPLTVVDTRREVDELKELLTIARCGPGMSVHLYTCACILLHCVLMKELTPRCRSVAVMVCAYAKANEARPACLTAMSRTDAGWLL